MPSLDDLVVKQMRIVDVAQDAMLAFPSDRDTSLVLASAIDKLATLLLYRPGSS